jgi:hypothetical protein
MKMMMVVFVAMIIKVIRKETEEIMTEVEEEMDME